MPRENPLAGQCPVEDAARAWTLPDARQAQEPPPVSAKAAVVMDAQTGRVLFQHEAHTPLPPASTTKIMTAILAIEHIPDERTAVIASTNAQAMRGSSVMGLWPSAPVSLGDLLYGLMLPSGNDAAIELALALAPDEAQFVAAMNDKATELGMRDSHFANPHGLDAADHYSSAYDLALLARYSLRNNRFRSLVGTADHYLPAPFDYHIRNGNSLLGAYPGTTGVKIGWTDSAGWTFVASAERDGRELIVALMDTQDRDADARTLFDWAFNAFLWRDVTILEVPVVMLLNALAANGGTLERWVSRCDDAPIG